MRKLIFGLIFILFQSNYSYSQTIGSVNILDTKYQTCLDLGENMLQCSQKYYFQMDSLLNIAYKNYRKSLTDKQKQELKTEQIKWLSSRDNYFKKIDKELLSRKGSKDDRMFAIDNKAQFVKKRVVYFIKKINQ